MGMEWHVIGEDGIRKKGIGIKTRLTFISTAVDVEELFGGGSVSCSMKVVAQLS